jgi:hypothetical protein
VDELQRAWRKNFPLPKTAERKTQVHMFYEAGRRIADADETMLELLFGSNPITDDELRALIKKRPGRYGRYAGFLGTRVGSGAVYWGC